MTIEQMRARKRELGYSYQKIARISGLPVGTVQKVLGGITKAPREETIWALEAVLKPVVPEGENTLGRNVVSQEHDFFSMGLSKRVGTGQVGEPAVLYRSGSSRDRKQGEYTSEDYYALPDGMCVELIDGVFYDMASPGSAHQIIAFEIGMQISLYIKWKKGKCIPLMGPLDVQLGHDDRTVVQPDLSVVCDRDKVRKNAVYGAPDLVVEIMSAATRRKDMSIKLSKYAESGVREYWLVDPDRKRVLVYLLEQEELPVIYDFQDRVPVGIFHGELSVNFAQINEYLGEW